MGVTCNNRRFGDGWRSDDSLMFMRLNIICGLSVGVSIH